jgi:hypothetical protein
VTFSRAGVEHAVDLTLIEPPGAAESSSTPTGSRERRREPSNGVDGLVRDVQRSLRR